ncbi:MAG: class I SAM-dependent methyltransferase [Chitinophagaceae bacterium]|nr:class I SAM-dependent methyltransferase [Chitinophagaceae bacterium]
MKHWFLIRQYLSYLLNAKSAHGVHSPFVFDFINSVLQASKQSQDYQAIQALRKQLYADQHLLHVEDFGAGSLIKATHQRKVCDIAKNAGRNHKFGKLLSTLIQRYPIQNVIELGTSLGIATSYMASAKPNVQITTLEGSREIAAYATKSFDYLQLKNIKQVIGNFDEVFLPTLQSLNSIDLIFIDGNHRKEPTLRYFQQALPFLHEHSILIFDDIHWSPGMQEAWHEIKAHPSVTLSIDLFYFGLVFFNKEFKVKQDFILKF